MADLEKFRRETRAWLLANAPESIAGLQLGEGGGSWGGRRPSFDHPDMKTWLEVMAEKGWTAPTWPREYGGGGLDKAEAKVLAREMTQLRLPAPLVGFGLAALPPGFLDNQYLLTLYYTGIIGLVVFVWLLWTALRTSYSAYGSLEGGSRGLALAWLAATVGLAVAGLAGSPFVAIRVRQVYWFLAALAVAATHVAAARRVEAGERDVGEPSA